MPKVLSCPDVTQLSELLAGKVQGSDKESLLDHLETCDNCASQLATVTSDDSLVELVRQAKSQGDTPFKDKVRNLIDSLSKIQSVKTPTQAEEKTLLPAGANQGADPARLMMFPCPKCRKNLKVKASVAGKKVKCPLCQAVAEVPVRDVAAERTIAPAAPPGPEPTRESNESTSDTLPPGEKAVDPDLIGFLSPAQGPDELGRLGHYRVLKVLGAGGMGVVFKAEDLLLSRPVALKAILPSLGASTNVKARFLREAKAAAQIKHDHIVSIYQVGEERGIPFLAMEFLQGESLDDRLKREERLPIADVLRIGREMAEGLEAAHDGGLVHRDIKPANVWLEEKRRAGGVSPPVTPVADNRGANTANTPRSPSRVKILDFGLARATDGQQNLTQSGAIVGTPAFMAPEQAQGKPVDQRCDLFSLGCVLYRMSTGQAPFKGTDTVSTLVAVALENPTHPHEIDANIPRNLSDLVMRLLAKDPQNRPATAREVAECLDEIAAQIKPPAPAPRSADFGPPPPPPAAKPIPTPQGEVLRTLRVPSSSSPRRQPLVLAAIMAALFAVIAVAGVVYRIQTDNGELIITTNSEDVEVVIKQGGKQVTIIDTKTSKEIKLALRSGEYQLELKGAPEGLQLNIKNATLTRGDTVLAKIERVTPARPAESKPVDSPVATNRFTNSLGMEFALVPKGKSWLGGGNGKQGIQVDIPQDFYLGVHEVTQEQWLKVMSKNPSWFSRVGEGADMVRHIDDDELKRFPVEKVTWKEAMAFVRLVNDKVKKDATEAGWEYRLPTEQQWEYACRGGPMADRTESAFDYYIDKPSTSLSREQANFEVSGLQRTSKVGSYPPNRLGLYDMHGNVWEWCEDPFDPKGGSTRVRRGGGWSKSAEFSRAAFRIGSEPSTWANNFGLRLARIPVGITSEPYKKPADPPGLANRFTNSLGMEFALVPRGKSWLAGGNGREGTTEVNISQDFYLGVYEVTQEDWQKVMGVDKNSSAFKGEKNPVENVSWTEADTFVTLVNEKTRKDGGEAGWQYRLPTEEQWEYACRGGPMTDKADSAFDFYFEKPTKSLSKELANFQGASLKRPCKVGSYPPNRLGLYDMHGNVMEWCADLYEGKDRGMRGGGWSNDPEHCAAASPGWVDPSKRASFLGLRLVRVPVAKENVPKETPAPLAPAPLTALMLKKFEGHTDRVHGVALSGDGKRALTGSEDAKAILWDTSNGTKIDTFQHADVVKSVALNGDGTRALTGSRDKTAVLWNTAKDKKDRKMMEFRGHDGEVNAVAMSADSRFILTGSEDKTAILWSAESGKKIHTFEGHAHAVLAVALSADGKFAVTGSGDGKAILWDTDQRTKIRTFEGHLANVISVALSGDGKQVLTGAQDTKAILWDVASGEKIHTFEGHQSSVMSVALHPSRPGQEAKYALTVSGKNSILWDVVSGTKLLTIGGHTNRINGVAMSPVLDGIGGMRILTGSVDKTAVLWEVKAAPPPVP
jgi:formylglycine-generating enzyme required for sulfatase activity/WD40 repeat protein/serine/threonine protein kinase